MPLVRNLTATDWRELTRKADLADYYLSQVGANIHSSAAIALPATIEEFVTIEEGVVIEENCHIRSHCRIGRDSHLQQGVIVKCGAIFGPRTICEKDVFIGPNVVTTSNLGSKVSGVIIRQKAFIGAGSIIMPGIIIAENVIVGALSFVNQSLLTAGATYVGAPARRIK